jgi:hypothetical protein
MIENFVFWKVILFSSFCKGNGKYSAQGGPSDLVNLFFATGFKPP